MIPLLLALLGCGGDTPTAVEEPTATPAKRGKARARAKAPAPTPVPGELVDVVKRRDGSTPPNVLVVVWDTARADRMSTYGYDKPTTPHLDVWAKKARRYDRAVSPGVWTLPSHASLFTALPVRMHGVTADTKFLEDRFVTVAEALSEIGYDSWVFSANPYMSSETNILQGFRTIEHPWDDVWQPKVAAHMAAKLLPDDASTPVSPKWTGRGGAGGNKYLYKEAGPVGAEAFGRFLERVEDGRPWFAFMNYMEPHLPRIPSQAARDKVMTAEQQARGLVVPETTTHFHEWMVGAREFDDVDLAAISGLYDASLIDVDLATHQLLQTLEASGVADDTIVVITSDHGESLGEHDLLLHKYGVFNTLARVPLLVSWPGHLEPGVSYEPKSVADVLADVVELGDIPVTEAVAKGLANRPTNGVDGVVVEFNAVAQGSLDRMRKLHGVTDLERFQRTFQGIELGDYKYTLASSGEAWLHDVVSDPSERQDLGETKPQERGELGEALEAWKKAVPAYERGRGVEARAEVDEEMKQGLEALGYIE
jgi:arylsulfatase A-like enzyme